MTATHPPTDSADEVARLLRHVLDNIDELKAMLSARRKDSYTVAEVAGLTGRSEYTVRRWITEGRLTAIRLAEGGPRGRLIVARSELDRLVADGRGAHISPVAVGDPNPSGGPQTHARES